ncbi:MAG: NapC/NirT family cytochrome c [Oligoflexia bacterium]|nr:NapC/NirT family cytochrome c [Oligoflexia bacterium]
MKPNQSALTKLILAGMALGALLLGGAHSALEATNTQRFCASCHERDASYKEYRASPHFSNRSGVRAGCPDCHVPRPLGAKLARKLVAAREVWAQVTGAIDTPEKFEARRMEMATREWDRMKASNSRECRSCHVFEAMSAETQKPSVFKKHVDAEAAGKTCIDCHKGVVHNLPKEYRDPDEE